MKYDRRWRTENRYQGGAFYTQTDEAVVAEQHETQALARLFSVLEVAMKAYVAFRLNVMAVYDYPRFSKTEVIQAGRDFAQRPATQEQLGHALQVTHNWRASHWFPLSNLLRTLNRRARKIDADSYAVQRVKRLESIGRKLREFKTT